MWTQPKACPVSFQWQRLSTVTAASQVLETACRRILITIVLKLVVELSRYVRLSSGDTQFTAKKSMRLSVFTSATSHLKLAYEWCVTSSEHEGTSACTKTKPSSSGRSHWKTYRPVPARIHHSQLKGRVLHNWCEAIWALSQLKCLAGSLFVPHLALIDTKEKSRVCVTVSLSGEIHRWMTSLCIQC